LKNTVDGISFNTSPGLKVFSGTLPQRRTRCEAWCEERAVTASPAASLRAKGCVIVCSINREKQRSDVRRAGASARTSEHDRASASARHFIIE